MAEEHTKGSCKESTTNTHTSHTNSSSITTTPNRTTTITSRIMACTVGTLPLAISIPFPAG